MPQILTPGALSPLNGSTGRVENWDHVSQRQAELWISQPMSLTSPTPPQQAAEELPNIKFSFSHLGSRAVIEHFARDTESGKAWCKGFRMHSQLSLPRASRPPALAPCPCAAVSVHPTPAERDRKNLQGMEISFPRCEGKAVHTVVDNISVSPHSFPSQAGFSPTLKKLPWHQSSQHSFHLMLNFPPGRGMEEKRQEEPCKHLKPAAVLRIQCIYIKKKKKERRTQHHRYSLLGNGLSRYHSYYYLCN